MRLSTSTCIFFNRPDGSKIPITQCIRECRNAGFEVMDMNFHDASVFKTDFVGDNWERYIDEIGQTANIVGVEFSQGHSHFYNFTEDKAENEYLETLVRRGIIASQRLGIPYLVIHAATDFSSLYGYKDSKRKNVEYFSHLLEFAGNHCVNLAIENLWELNVSPRRRYTSNTEELLDLVESLDFDNVSICWDVEHSKLMEQDLKENLKLVESYLSCTHISDYVTKTFDHILPFSGISDWDLVIDAFASIIYEGDFTLEVHRPTLLTPLALVPPLLRYSHEVGTYLVNEIQRRKHG